jgi:uncharacterized membrane protein YqjE
VVHEIKEEVKEFVDTRVMLAKSELRETVEAMRLGIPMAVMALVLVGTGYLLLTLALVGLVAVAFWGSPYAWFYSFLIVGGLWLILGALTAFFAYNEFRSHGMFMKRTMTVLQQDKVWIQNEARSQV